MTDVKGLALYRLMTPHSPWVKTPKERAEMTMMCHDADYIPRVKNAGSKTHFRNNDVQIMHNGLYVKTNGYQGEWQAEIIEKLGGVHEPQEEKAFYEVLKRLDAPAKMMELGSWWSYYSMWFLKSCPGSTAICCEPDSDNLMLGKQNMALNGFKEGRDVYFYSSAAGKTNGKHISFRKEDGSNQNVLVRTVDSILEERKIQKLDILHMDIQGAELDALRGALNSISKGKIRFIFISTHHFSISKNPIIHQQCIKFIEAYGGSIIARHNIQESCSGDGLIVASFDERDRDFSVEISRQPTWDSLFRESEYDVDILWRQHEKLARTTSKQISKVTDINSKLKQEVLELKSQNADLRNELGEIRSLRDHIRKQLKLRLGVKK